MIVEVFGLIIEMRPSNLRHPIILNNASQVRAMQIRIQILQLMDKLKNFAPQLSTLNLCEHT